jgi:hypothetical protein
MPDPYLCRIPAAITSHSSIATCWQGQERLSTYPALYPGFTQLVCIHVGSYQQEYVTVEIMFLELINFVRKS